MDASLYLPVPVPRPAAGPRRYEVDDAAGSCLYRGSDLGLADEICGGEPGAHLVVLADTGATAGVA
jgi:hypothetical protein